MTISELLGLTMQYLTIFISVLALSLSAFTFYWVQIRIKNELHLVRIDSLGDFRIPSFALINSGTRDILITSIAGRFIHAEGHSGTYPNQYVDIGEGHSMLIKAGTSVPCKINFLEELDESFVMQGKLRKNVNTVFYDFVFEVVVDWVDSLAQSHKGRAQIATYGISEDLEIRSFAPLEAKHDLYKNSKIHKSM
ncbi:MAG: hypothetical protein AB2809_13240 [Candidatus Thiodiazotropha sp.]